MHLFMSLRSRVFARKCAPSERTVLLRQAHGVAGDFAFRVFSRMCVAAL